MPVRPSLRLMTLAAALACVNVSSASALEQQAFEAGAFKSAQDAGKPVVMHVTAPWCPTCKAQHATLEGLAKNPELSGVTVFTVDFDSQANVWKSVNARSQSTIIGYSGGKETGRLVGETMAQPIEALVKSTLAK